MSKILNFPKVIAYVTKDASYLAESKVVFISDYQKDHKIERNENNYLSYSLQKSPFQVLSEEDDDKKEALEGDDGSDKGSSADKAIYFSSFISF